MTLLNDILKEMATPAHRKAISSAKWHAPEQVEQFLYDNGFDMIGEGIFAQVWASPNSDKVVKFSTGHDRCYIKFAQHAQKHPSKYLPKVYDFIKYKVDQDEHSMDGKIMFITVLEKLVPIDVEQIKMTDENKSIIAWLYTQDMWQDGGKTLAKINKAFGINAQHEEETEEVLRQMAEKLENSNHPFVKIYHDMLGQFNKGSNNKCFGDLHDGNVFYRPSDSTVVYIDPYV